MDAHLSVRERVLEVVVGHEAHACLRRVSYGGEASHLYTCSRWNGYFGKHTNDQCHASRVEACDAFRFQCIPNDRYRTLSLADRTQSKFRDTMPRMTQIGRMHGLHTFPLNCDRVFTNSVGYVMNLPGRRQSMSNQRSSSKRRSRVTTLTPRLPLQSSPPRASAKVSPSSTWGLLAFSFLASWSV